MKVIWCLAISICQLIWVSGPAYSIKLSSDQVLKIGNRSEPRFLDPALAEGQTEGYILKALFEGLVTFDPFSLEVVPGVAESWSVSKDGMQYQFKIRKNAKWSDGTELNANDFVYSWQRVLNPKTASAYAYILYPIKGAKPYNLGKTKDANSIGVKALDPYTLQVDLEHPVSYFLQLVAFWTYRPVPKHIVEKFDGELWTREKNMVSNGPFKMDQWRLNQHVKLVKNPLYWNASFVKLKELFYYPSENQETEQKSFLSKQLDITYDVPPLRIPGYLAAKDKNSSHPFHTDPYLRTYFYRFNVNVKPLNDARVRRALAITVDRKAIVERVTRGGEKAATSFTPHEIRGYKFKGKELPVTITDEVLTEAKNLMAQAGYPEGKGFPKLELLYNTADHNKKIAVAIQQMWKEHLGIEVYLINKEWRVYLNTLNNKDYQIARSSWGADYYDPNTFLDMFVTDGTQNNTNWSNKTYDQAIKNAAVETDLKKRFEYFNKAEKELLEDLPIFPIYFENRKRMVAPRVKMQTSKGKIVAYRGNLLDEMDPKYLVIASE